MVCLSFLCVTQNIFWLSLYGQKNTNIFQNLFQSVPQRKESLTGLEQHGVFEWTITLSKSQPHCCLRDVIEISETKVISFMIFLSYGYGERVDKNSSVYPWCVRTAPVECLWHLMWCHRISHAVKAHLLQEELCRNPIFITFMNWGKKLFLHTSLLLSRPYTCHPHIA